MCAEGGTFEFHMVSMARSKDIWGPYEACKENPSSTTYGINNCIQHAGHSDLVQDSEGTWWIVMLALKKKNGRYAMGRETFLSSVEWNDGGRPEIGKISTKIETSRACQRSDYRDGRDLGLGIHPRSRPQPLPGQW